MSRLRLLTLIALAACGGGGSSGTTGPAAVSTVTLTAASATIGIGQTTTVTATPKDASGNVLTGRTVTYTTSNAAIATVSTTGTVTGVSIGTVVITATVEAKSATTPITVTIPGPDCTGNPGVTMTPGQVLSLSSAQRATLCVPGGSTGAEYALIPVNTDVNRLSSSITFSASNTTTTTGAPLATVAAASRAAASRPIVTNVAMVPLVASLQAVEGMVPRNTAFEHALRLKSRTLLRSVHAAQRARPASVRGAGVRANITGLATNPALGSFVTLNANGNDPCTNPINRVSRVAAISNAAIVIVDTTAPAGGFTDAEYLSIARTFDTLVYNLDTLNFGAPYDMDGNGKVILFFTSAVNQLTAPGSGSYVGGFFFERDLIPRVANTVVPFNCATSNEGEMFYLPVVDPTKKYNEYFTSKSAMFTSINGTTVHEFQHLINSSRRIYVTPEVVDDEEVWLNEGMSHFAEELLWYAVTGLAPKQNLTFAQTTTGTALFNAMNAYQADNLERFNEYVGNVEGFSSYLLNDDLSTRGATWALLRYAVDQSPNPSRSYTKALVDAPTQGIPNFDRTFPDIGGLAGAVKRATVANFTDDAGLGVPAIYSYPSWNYRDWLPHFTTNNQRYPLATRPLITGSPQAVSLVAGGSSVLRFRVNAGATGGVSITFSGSAPSSSVDLILIRTQ